MKAEILRILKETPGYVSGQQLCERLGVSRTMVWKAIRQLEKEGCQIQAVRNRGYCLMDQGDVLTEAELKSVLDTEWLGKKLVCFDETDSTNIRARRLAEEGAPHGTLVVAERQTAGRGRRGRNWDSPAGSGIWFSMMLRPEIEPVHASMITLVAGMAVVKGIEEVTGLKPMIKWPNDAVLNGKKISGILTEMSTEEDSVRYVVVGVGMNINTETFPEELEGLAASLKTEAGREFRRSLVLGAVCRAFETYFEIFQRDRSMEGLMEEYNRMLVNLDRQVCVLDPKGEYTGTARGIDRQGSLLVEKEDRTVIPVISGEVSVRGIYGYV